MTSLDHLAISCLRRPGVVDALIRDAGIVPGETLHTITFRISNSATFSEQLRELSRALAKLPGDLGFSSSWMVQQFSAEVEYLGADTFADWQARSEVLASNRRDW